MAAWLPAIKAIFPYVTQVITLAVPIFTQKPAQEASHEVISHQIAELQEAVTHNAESLKVLATQMQKLLSEIEAGAAKAEMETRSIKRLCVISIITSIAAIAISLAVWLH